MCIVFSGDIWWILGDYEYDKFSEFKKHNNYYILQYFNLFFNLANLSNLLKFTIKSICFHNTNIVIFFCLAFLFLWSLFSLFFVISISS